MRHAAVAVDRRSPQVSAVRNRLDRLDERTRIRIVGVGEHGVEDKTRIGPALAVRPGDARPRLDGHRVVVARFDRLPRRDLRRLVEAHRDQRERLSAGGRDEIARQVGVRRVVVAEGRVAGRLRRRVADVRESLERNLVVDDPRLAQVEEDAAVAAPQIGVRVVVLDLVVLVAVAPAEVSGRCTEGRRKQCERHVSSCCFHGYSP